MYQLNTKEEADSYLQYMALMNILIEKTDEVSLLRPFVRETKRSANNLLSIMEKQIDLFYRGGNFVAKNGNGNLKLINLETPLGDEGQQAFLASQKMIEDKIREYVNTIKIDTI